MVRLLTVTRNAPSCGLLRTAMSAFAMILNRLRTGRDTLPGSVMTGSSTPQMRNRTTVPAPAGVDVKVARADFNRAADQLVAQVDDDGVAVGPSPDQRRRQPSFRAQAIGEQFELVQFRIAAVEASITLDRVATTTVVRRPQAKAISRSASALNGCDVA